MSAFLRKTLAGLLLVLVMATGARASEEKEITLGWTAWSDAEVIARMAKQILEQRMGYKVNMTMADIGIQYQGVATGDLDLMLMSWLPVTHANYMDRVGEDLVNLGVLYTRARLGWVVPAYVPEDVLKTIADLKKPEVIDKLDGRIQGIDPGAGLMQASERAMEEYDLEDDYQLVSASGAAMTAAIERAVRRDEWVVATAWNPHWMFAKWDLRYLEDPKGVLGGLERIHALARKGFYQDHPEVAEFVIRMNIPLDELEIVMFKAAETSYEEAVADYIKQNPKRVNYWVTGRFD